MRGAPRPERSALAEMQSAYEAAVAEKMRPLATPLD